MRKKRKYTKRQSKVAAKPLMISIHGQGIDIDAKIESAADVGNAIGKLLENTSLRQTSETSVPSATISAAYALDLFREVISNADNETLQAISDMIDDRIGATPAPNVQ